MEHWQFLIQKHGDRSWQSLESANLKISPGKYRVLARSSLSARDVEVRVIHSTIQEFPPKRRVFKRLRRLDANGLMAVIPFTDFKPGIWEIRCSGDLMSDMLGESWQYSLVINVSSASSSEQLLLGSGDDTGANFDSSAIVTADSSDSTMTSISKLEDVEDTDTSSPILEDPMIYEPVNPVLKGDTVEQIVQNLLDLALPASEAWDDEPSQVDTTPILPLSLPLELCLEQDNYIAQWGKTLQINGEVISAQRENLIDEQLSAINIYQLQIVTELRSPVESNILMTSPQNLANQVLPFKFSGNIQIPSDCESKLILGNINIYGSLIPNDEVTLLGNHSFSITADVTELLNLTSQAKNIEEILTEYQPEGEDNLGEKSEPIPLGLELFNLVKTPTLAKFRSLKPAGNLTLPPRIQAVILTDRVSPQLPKLPRIHKSMIAGNGGLADSFNSGNQLKKPAQVRPINFDKLTIKQVKTSFPFLKRLKPEPEPAIENTLSVVQNIPELAVSYENQDIANLENIPDLTVSYENHDIANLENIPELAVNYEDQDIPNISDISEIPPLETENSIDDSMTVHTPETSPLIQKWMAKQGYLLDEGIELVYQEQDQNQNLDQNPDDEQLNEEVSTHHYDGNVREITVEELVNDLNLHFNADLESQTIPVLDLPEHLRLDTTETTPKPEPIINTSTRLSEEIVLDEEITSIDEEENESIVRELENSLSQQWEFLPTPQLFLPSGELLAGASVKVRLEMPINSPTVLIKLWVEDYQTRSLLDGPHFVQDLRPTPWGSWEANTQILVPLGCVEILVGAIALDMNSQQESHKVTIVKTVIPPDLSTIEVDEVLGL